MSNIFQIPNSKFQLPNTRRAFSLIETLVAIAVLMIAVAGPLVVASKGLTAAIYAKDQMIASFLAQESMEVIKNNRDNALNIGNIGDNTWNLEASTCGEFSLCDASSVTSPSWFNEGCGSSLIGCELYYSPTAGYAPQNISGSVESIFKRRFVFTPVANANSSDREGIITVIVTWNEGTIPNELRLSSELTESKR